MGNWCSNSGIYIPSKINPEMPVFFVIDNVVISLDKQVYMKSKKLKPKDDINKNLFRIGELNTVFEFLKSTRNYVNMNGLDQAFVDSNNYGPIIDGNKEVIYMKKCIEAFANL